MEFPTGGGQGVGDFEPAVATCGGHRDEAEEGDPEGHQRVGRARALGDARAGLRGQLVAARGQHQTVADGAEGVGRPGVVQRTEAQGHCPYHRLVAPEQPAHLVDLAGAAGGVGAGGARRVDVLARANATVMPEQAGVATARLSRDPNQKGIEIER
jgi:hypothetical protein